jgi:ankyrin repeat protein
MIHPPLRHKAGAAVIWYGSTMMWSWLFDFLMYTKAPCVGTLPFEILREVALMLPPTDVRSLSATCKALRAELVGAHFKARWSVAHRREVGTWAEIGDCDAVKEMLAIGSISSETADHCLKSAATQGHAGVVRVLIDGVPVGTEIVGSAMHLAAENGHVECVRMLLQVLRDANVGPRYFVDYSLMGAARGGHDRIVTILMDAGADVHYQEDLSVCNASANGHVHVVHQLIAAGARLTTRNYLALRQAIQHGHDAVVCTLLRISSPPMSMVNDCLAVAATNGHHDIATLLLSKHPSKCTTAFATLYAFINGRVYTVYILVCHLSGLGRRPNQNNSEPNLESNAM